MSQIRAGSDYIAGRIASNDTAGCALNHVVACRVECPRTVRAFPAGIRIPADDRVLETGGPEGRDAPTITEPIAIAIGNVVRNSDVVQTQ